MSASRPEQKAAMVDWLDGADLEELAEAHSLVIDRIVQRVQVFRNPSLFDQLRRGETCLQCGGPLPAGVDGPCCMTLADS